MCKHIYQINEQAFIIDFGSIINTEINNNVINHHNYILSNIDKIKSLGIKNCPPHYVHLSMGLVSYLAAMYLEQKEYIHTIV